MIRIAVVDDDNPICTELEYLINKAACILSAEVQIDIYNSGEHFTNILKHNERYDLIFLDIELDSQNGIDVGHYIRDFLKDEATQIAYVSGKNGYDRQLFEFRPIDFIEKPVSSEKILAVLRKYIRIYGNQSELFKYKINRDTFYARIDEIIYFKSDDRKVILVKETEVEDFYGSIEKIHQQLRTRGFFMPHRSYLINYRFIKGFQAKTIIMTNGEIAPISENRKNEVFRIQLLMENGE